MSKLTIRTIHYRRTYGRTNGPILIIEKLRFKKNSFLNRIKTILPKKLVRILHGYKYKHTSFDINIHTTKIIHIYVNDIIINDTRIINTNLN